MITEISSVIASARAAYEMAKGISSLMIEVDRNEAISKILEVLISVQQDALTVQSQAHELEIANHELQKKLMEYEKWSETELQYELKEIAPGIFVYSYKVTDNSTKPVHWLCPKCFQEKTAHIIQFVFENAAGKQYFCPNCKTKLIIRSSTPHAFSIKRGGSWMTE